MSSQETPKTIQDSEGTNHEAFTNPHMVGRIFIEVTPQAAESIEGQTYRGKMSGGEPTGCNGMGYMVYAPTVAETVFVDVTDNGWTVTEYQA